MKKTKKNEDQLSLFDEPEKPATETKEEAPSAEPEASAKPKRKRKKKAAQPAERWDIAAKRIIAQSSRRKRRGMYRE